MPAKAITAVPLGAAAVAKAVVQAVTMLTYMLMTVTHAVATGQPVRLAAAAQVAVAAERVAVQAVVTL